MKPPSVVFFDVGGTLLEVSPSVGHVYAGACEALGHAVDPGRVQRAFDLAWMTLSKEVPRGADRYRLFPGGETGWWERVSSFAFEQCGVPPSARPPLAELRAVFAGAGAWRVFPETREALAELARRGHRLAVLSNWDSRLPMLLDTLGLRHHFEVIVHSAEAGFEKPHRGIFDAALRAMAVGPADAIHIGDRYEEDFAGARSAGLRALLVSRDEADTPAGEHRVSDLNEAVVRIVS